MQKQKEVKKSAKEDKSNYIAELATEAEAEAEQCNMKKLYNITRIVSGKRMSPKKTGETHKWNSSHNIRGSENKMQGALRRTLEQISPRTDNKYHTNRGGSANN